jgi:hypothetical protein
MPHDSESYATMPRAGTGFSGATNPTRNPALAPVKEGLEMDDEINNIEDWMDFGIGDSMDGAGRSPESYEDRPVSVGGILHAIRERHQVRSCAYCGKSIRENEVMYTRDDLVFFCDIGHDKAYMKRHGGQ